jgi:HAD superfamily hydrolase (TIGR01490 family)
MTPIPDPVEAQSFPPRRRPSAAFFDLDRTLIKGSSAFTFAKAAWRSGMMPTRQLVQDGTSAIAFRFRGASDKKVDRVRERVLGAVKGASQSDLVALNAVILPKLLSRVRPEAQDLIDLHRRAGRHTFIVSASPQELVEPLAVALGMTGGIGTVAEVVEGLYSGALVGPFTYGPGKAAAIEAMSRRHGYDLERCYSYSDSASDLPMLEAVGHPVAVNPDPTLASVAHQRGWPQVEFSRRTKRWVRRASAVSSAAGLAAGAFVAGRELGRRGND